MKGEENGRFGDRCSFYRLGLVDGQSEPDCSQRRPGPLVRRTPGGEKMRKNQFVKLFVVLAAGILLAACQNPRAESEGVWYFPWTWGDRTLAQTLTERCTGGATSTQVGSEQYACPDSNQAQVKANEGDSQSETLVTTETSDQVSSTGPTTREETDLLLFGADANGKPLDILVQIGTESMPDPRDQTRTVGGYQFNTANPAWVYEFVLPQGWWGTLHLAGKDKPELFRGDGETSYSAWRATIRNPANFSPNDRVNTDQSGCELLAAENTNGLSQEWTFTVLAGNIQCSNAPTANVQDNLTANRTDEVYTAAECPTVAGQQLTPGNDGSAFCKYSGAVITLVIPAGWKADWWTGSEVAFAQAGDEITTGEATFRPLP